MNKRIFTLLIGLLVCVYSFAQKPTAAIAKMTVAPVIDGVIDAMWADVPANSIDRVFLTDVPTLGAPGTTYWKAVWDEKGIYILINVNDDVFSPNYLYPGSEDYRYDKIEVYFDANFDKVDGKGVNDPGSGHYAFSYNFSATNINGSLNTDGENQYAFKANGGPYVAEYYIAYSKLKDRDGNQVDKGGEIGFDITIIDSDSDQPERRRAVWANQGNISESFDVMDDCGIITLTGAQSNTLVESISLTPDLLHLDNTISVDNDTIKFTPVILPIDATVQTVNWSLVNGTGKARLNQGGVLTAISDGTVTVVATSADGSYIAGSQVVTITGQVVGANELSVLIGGTFPVDGIIAGGWGKGGGVGTGSVVDGVVFAEVGTGGNQSAFQVTQDNFIVEPDITYYLMFDAWTDAETGTRVVICDFEDPANGYARYGLSSDGLNGRSEWNDVVSNTSQTFTHTVVFDQLLPTTKNAFIFQLGNEASNVFLDNVFLFTETDYNNIISGVTANKENAIKIFPNPVADQLNITLNASSSKISIFNSLGQKVIENVTTGNIARINVANLQKGVYFVKINNGTSLKFIK